MHAERWQRIDQLFHLTLAQEPDQRALFLARECANDESLRNEVETLLASHEQAADFIENPASDLAAELLANDQIGLVEGQSIGPYEIVSPLGTGGMGEVYLAHDKKLGRQVAIKSLPARFTVNADRLRRFEQEARAVSALNHPNIVTIFELSNDNGLQFIVNEFVAGQTLRQRMGDHDIGLRLALDVSIQVASALEAAHAAGIVHRDIKPENIMLRADGYVKVLDFGLAKLTEAATTNAATDLDKLQTESGLVMGTATYMSPEQARGLPVDMRTDIFSLGVVLYEMIAGRPPFEGDTSSDVVAAILKEDPESLSHYSPEVPTELEWMMKKALAKDREERYQTIKDFLIDLKRLKQELEIQARLDGLPTRRQNRNVATRSTDEALKKFTSGFNQEVAIGEGPVEKKSVGIVISKKLFAAITLIVALLSLLSFYAGLKQVPRRAQPRFRQLTFRRGAIVGAKFSPDGNTLIYSAAFDGKPVELFTSHLDNPESRSLKLPAGIQSISSNGDMAILLNCELDAFGCHDGTLAQLPLVGGTPRQIKEHVDEAAWAPNGQDLAIVTASEGQYQIEYPIGTVIYRAPGRIGGLRVLPDADLVAFVDNPVLGDTRGSVMLVNRKGETRKLSRDWTAIGNLTWSPTTNELWISAGVTGNNEIYALTLSGSERLVYSGAGNTGLRDISRDGHVLVQRGIPRSHMIGYAPGFGQERDLAWFDYSTSADISADGKNLLFYEHGVAVGNVSKVYLRSVDGSNEPIPLGKGRALALSPDGKWALAVQESPQPQLVLLPTGPGELRLLPRSNITEFSYASWFPNGEKILFTGLEPGHAIRSYTQDIIGGEAKAITEDRILALLVSPDGKRLVTWAEDNNPDGKYYLTPVEGSGFTPIPGLEFGEVPMQWSTDGRLYVHGGGNFTNSIYLVDVVSGRRELHKEIVPDQVGLLGFEVTPGGILITPDGKSYVYTYWSALRDLFLTDDLN